jgi:hypothetical protein
MKTITTLRYILITGSLIMALSIKARAQHGEYEPLPSHELSVGVKAGLSDMWGDVGTKGVLSHYFNGKYFQNTHYMGGLFIRYSATPWLAARLEVNAGSIYATDAWNIKEANKGGPGSPVYNVYVRNQDMKSTIVEGLLNIEVSPLRIFDNGKSARWRIQPVVVAGIGVFHFNPKTTYTEPSGDVRWVETHPLHLEGEGLDYIDAPKGYKLTQICMPVGLGLRYEVNSRLSIGFEYLLRLTFTDYLDGVSNKYVDPAIFSQHLGESDAAIAKQVYNKSYQIDPSIYHPAGDIRGNPKNRDAYSTMGFHLNFRIPSKADMY